MPINDSEASVLCVCLCPFPSYTFRILQPLNPAVSLLRIEQYTPHLRPSMSTSTSKPQSSANLPPTFQRKRLPYAVAVATVIVIGLASRRFPAMFPAFLGKYPGDALWALMVFLLVGTALPRRTTAWVAVVAVIISLAVEFSQLYQAPWIDSIRSTTLGHLVLGAGFSWADIIAYVIGIVIGSAGEYLLTKRRRLD